MTWTDRHTISALYNTSQTLQNLETQAQLKKLDGNTEVALWVRCSCCAAGWCRPSTHTPLLPPATHHTLTPPSSSPNSHIPIFPYSPTGDDRDARGVRPVPLLLPLPPGGGGGRPQEPLCGVPHPPAERGGQTGSQDAQDERGGGRRRRGRRGGFGRCLGPAAGAGGRRRRCWGRARRERCGGLGARCQGGPRGAEGAQLRAQRVRRTAAVPCCA